MRKFKFTPMLLVALCIGFTSCENDEPTVETHDVTVDGVFKEFQWDEMVAVDGGTFLMGAQKTDESKPNYDAEAGNDEAPVHEVTLSDYYIGRYEVTQQMWKYVMNYSGLAHDGSQMGPYIEAWLNIDPNETFGLGDYYPAYNVSYNDIVELFIPRLNKITGKAYRLPTEAEWEFAARGGNKSNGYIYSGSSRLGDVAWYSSNASGATHQVNIKLGNELGIYGMSGNVYEWCSDLFNSNYYANSPSNNPTGATTGNLHMIRGGGWSSAAKYCRVSYREYKTPEYSSWNLGFRLALDK